VVESQVVDSPLQLQAGQQQKEGQSDMREIEADRENQVPVQSPVRFPDDLE